MDVTLVPIEPDGTPRGWTGPVPAAANEALRATVELYSTVGFREPWICYLAIADETAIGTCGFKSPPRDGRVEIAYFTFPEFEGHGVASAMAGGLVRIALTGDASVAVAAQTLPARTASHRILEKLGFRHVGVVEDPEDGTVWEWRLAMSRSG